MSYKVIKKIWGFVGNMNEISISMDKIWSNVDGLRFDVDGLWFSVDETNKKGSSLGLEAC